LQERLWRRNNRVW